jgi:DNA modification methylase
LGSGTTAVACREIKRQFIGFEIDKSYFQIAQDRLNGLTQQDRKIKDNGQIDIFDLMEE